MVEVMNGVPIRVASAMNTWMDCVFIVKPTEVEEAKEILEIAWNAFWKQSNEPYGEFLENALYEAGIEYEVFYTNETEED